jgi:N-acyl-D-aspartate/D-glutamate deacylase
MHDTVIVNGLVVDGTGAPRRHAAVAVTDGKVVEVGDDVGPARRVVDAADLVVTPGFVDLHTHLDVQPFWDPTLSPSPLHGVTTVIGGNCGFSVAPLAGSSAEYLMRMLARVEGMPLSTLEHAVPWSWRSTGEFFAALDGRLAINAGFMAGHSALRRAVMGAAGAERAATETELDAMATLLARSLSEGALGFSSSWNASHRDGAGQPVPSRHATVDELVRLAAVCADAPGTSISFSPSAGQGEFSADDCEAMIRMSLAARRPLNWNFIDATAERADEAAARLSLGAAARARGARVVALVLARNPGSRYSFASGVGLDSLPGWSTVMALDLDGKLAALSDPVERARLRLLSDSAPTTNSHADWAAKQIVDISVPEYRCYQGLLVADIAAERGMSPFDTLVEIACADQLRTTFKNRPRHDTDEDWVERARFFTSPDAVIGASDAGAHLDMVATFDYPSVVLAEAVAGRGLLSLEDAVRRLTDAPARLYGLAGRGRIEVGAEADLVLLDPARVTAPEASMRFDLPDGGGRLYSAPAGIERVFVAGVEIVRNGGFTGATPGRVVRRGLDTTTPSLTASV